MSKSLIFILVIGVLSILSGIFLAYSGSDSVEYISAFFAGVVLIIAAFYFKDGSNQENHFND